jgi:hypothetical protein
VDTASGLTNLDPFVSARFAAVAHGSDLTPWIVSPDTAEDLSKLKVQSGSNQSLLQFVEDRIAVAGLPVLVSDQVDANTVAWDIPQAHVMFVQRSGTTVEQFAAVDKDGTYIRAVSRIGLAFLNPARHGEADVDTGGRQFAQAGAWREFPAQRSVDVGPGRGCADGDFDVDTAPP